MTSPNVENVLRELLPEARDHGARPNKDAMVLALVDQCGLSISEATREWRRFAEHEGLVVTPKKRADEISAICKDKDIRDPDVRAGLANELAAIYNLSAQTVQADIRTYARKAGIDPPARRRYNFADAVQIVKKGVEEYGDARDARAKILSDLQSNLGYTKNFAASVFRKARHELGVPVIGSRPLVSLDQVVEFIRDRRDLPRKALVNELSTELGYSKASAASFVRNMDFAEEWRRQETALYPADRGASRTT